jgi:TonB-dependent receptor
MACKMGILCSVSCLTLIAAAAPAGAQTGAPVEEAQVGDAAPTAEDAAEGEEIVVTGIRESLAAAAAIKRKSDQVVDSIVAEDIGKFPDRTTAAALQRVPGVQVTVSNNNEVANPIIRGLGDILTTLNGREIFTGAGRGFSFQDLPAEALARVDVYKSNSANLIEGGVAGVIDLRLHRPFDFSGFTLAANARGTYSRRLEKVDPSVGLLVSNRWETGAGEFGALVNVTFAKKHFDRPIAFNSEQRSSNFPWLGAPGGAAPTNVGGLNNYGWDKRPQANVAFQWRPSPELQFFAEGLYAGYRSNTSTSFILYDTFGASHFTNVEMDNNCDDYLVAGHGFFDGTGTVQHLCNITSLTAHNVLTITSNQAHKLKTDMYMLAGGGSYDSGPFHLDVDLSWQHSLADRRTFIIDTGKFIPSIDIQTNVGGGTQFSAPGNPLNDPADYLFSSGLYQDNSDSLGELFTIKADGRYDVGGVLQNIQLGGRYAVRDARVRQGIAFAGTPGGFYGTRVDAVGLPSDFLSEAPGIPQINNGAPFLVADTGYLLDRAMQNQLKTIFGLPHGDPDWDPTRGFDATEKTLAGYLQAKYEIPLGGITVDGLIGVRLTRTQRTISGTGTVIEAGVPSLVKVTRDTSDTDLLPNFSARARFGEGLQARFAYGKTISRPAFALLNPGLSYIVSTNPNIPAFGSSGNPDLRPQKSDNYDATLEYYFGRSSYVSVNLYYRNIKNRVVTGVSVMNIGGINYNISQPRNVGEATLKGLELSGQMFFDFLPGALSGFGIFGNYTLADSEITTEGDTLEGFDLLGVSKHNYNIGLIYEKYGLAVRAVYNHRSRYFDEDRTASFSLRPVGQTIFLNGVRPSGRLDLSVNYDVNEAITVSFDATNITKAKYRSYYDIELNPRDIRNDDSSFAFGVTFRM